MSDFIGVILAAGRGSRLYPVTEDIPKALVQVGKTSLLELQLNMLKNIGISEFIIVIDHLGYKITKRIGDGSKLGVKISYVKQDSPKGTAYALASIVDVVNKPFFLLLGDIYFKTKNLHEMINVWHDRKANGVLGTKVENEPEEIKKNFSIEFGDDGRVKKVLEKPKKLINKFKGCGLYLFDQNIFEAVNRTPRTALRDEYEITDSIQIFIDLGYSVYYSNSIEEDINITYPYDIYRLNIKLLEEKGLNKIMGNNIYIGENVRIKKSVLGDGINIGDNVVIEESVVLPGASVCDGSFLNKVIVTENRIIRI